MVVIKMQNVSNTGRREVVLKGGSILVETGRFAGGRGNCFGRRRFGAENLSEDGIAVVSWGI